MARSSGSFSIRSASRSLERSTYATPASRSSWIPSSRDSLPWDRAYWRFIPPISGRDFSSSKQSMSPKRRSSHLRKATLVTTSRWFTSSSNSKIATSYGTTCGLLPRQCFAEARLPTFARDTTTTLARLVARNASSPQWIRIIGGSEAPARFAADCDYARSYDPAYQDALNDDTSATGDLIGRLQWDFALAPSERRRFWFAVGVYTDGEQDALRRYGRIPGADDALEHTVASLEQILRAGRVLTPDPVINQGALWSKVNMRRVMASYPTGQAFTNDPGTYPNVVIRDAAWFVFGNDHFLPSFSRRLLDNLSAKTVCQRQAARVLRRRQRTRRGRRAEHQRRHAALHAGGQSPFPRHRRRGLAGEDVSGRSNARPVTSSLRSTIAASCFAPPTIRAATCGRSPAGAISSAATASTAPLPKSMPNVSPRCAPRRTWPTRWGTSDDGDEFAAASARIRDAMDAHLINPKNGLYYLNIDVDGTAHTDVTGDEIFPVIMRACSDETAFRIISRLNSPDFWTPAGLRTVSRLDPRFDPAAHSGLMGGVWPGLTWWYAFGSCSDTIRNLWFVRLRSSFEHYGADPQRYNTVPGQFSEWFDGESLANRGMRLSPWEPPRFLWAAVEGVCGLVLMPGLPRVNPLMPAGWNWVALRDVPYHGEPFSYFLVREAEGGVRVYATSSIDCGWPVEIYTADVSDDVRIYTEDAVGVALRRDERLVLLRWQYRRRYHLRSDSICRRKPFAEARCVPHVQ